MQIFNDHGFCYACRKYADIFAFTCKLGKKPFDQAVEWLLERKGIIPDTIIRKAPVEYLGPLPIEIARYYHSQLDADRRQYLYDRLLTDETIDTYLLGYRGDYQAYTIPFWEGFPGKSSIVSLQYRIAPWAENQQKKYWWERGRYKPCVLNQHLINHALVIVAFGSVDALLGFQDGIPIISASGLNTFSNEKKAESVWLRELLRDVQRVIVLPDGSTTEFRAAVEVMQGLGAEIKFFPYNVPKDYNAYRSSGKSTVDFIQEILEMSAGFYKERFHLLEPEHVDRLENMLALMFTDAPTARMELLQIGKDAEAHSAVVSYSIQQLMGQYGPRHFNAPLSSDEWWDLIGAFENAWESYTDLTQVIVDNYFKMEAKLGAF